MFEDLLDGGLECLRQFRNVPGEHGGIFQRFDPGIDGATAFMAEYQDQRRAKYGDGVLKAGQAFAGDEVARHANRKKVTACGVERVFGGDPRVGTTEYRHERVLAGHQGFALVLEVVCVRVSADIAFIACNQPL
ncbi:hypothetical protein D3C84_889600 [compost metagenome]